MKMRLIQWEKNFHFFNQSICMVGIQYSRKIKFLIQYPGWKEIFHRLVVSIQSIMMVIIFVIHDKLSQYDSYQTKQN